MGTAKYALLDTDFISKMHFIQGDEEDTLIDRVLELPGYAFYCHEQIQTELVRHNKMAPKWLSEKIRNSEIICYTDERILSELHVYFGESSCALYTQMLKKACDAFSWEYFERHYHALSTLDYRNLSTETYIEALRDADHGIGEHRNLGEIKTYVLLQMLTFLFGDQIYVFCSDDRDARNGVLMFENVRCISVLSSFLHLKKEAAFDRECAEPYIRSFLEFCRKYKQTSFRVFEASNASRICRVPCEQVFDEIFRDQFFALKNGFLKYKE